jgi:hypothetical protein
LCRLVESTPRGRPAAQYADPEPEDGLTAVVPNACVDSVSEFVRECAWPELEHELIEVVLDGAYEVIDLLQRSVDEDAPERIGELFSRLPGSWADPAARPQIEELVRTASHAEQQL